MSTTVVLVVLGAGLVHAMWNAMAKSLHDQFVSFALLNLGVASVCWIAWPFIGLPRSGALVYLFSSIACHVGYELFLMGAYRRTDFSQSYPIARGIAPLLVSVAGLVFANEHLSARGLLGIVGVVVGIIALAAQELVIRAGSSGRWRPASRSRSTPSSTVWACGRATAPFATEPPSLPCSPPRGS
jgi:multidrug transporter EmrE-like cation transporter